VQHLLHPSLPLELRQEFAKAYFSTDGVLDIAAQLLAAPGAPGKGKEKERCPDEELVLELWNLLCAPTRDVPFELKWHRDDIDIHRVCVAEEAAELARRKGIETAKGGGTHTQWNLALYPDSSLLVVPGSHLRPRTAVEAAALNADPWCPLEELEGAIAAELGPGDCVFYDNNILHRGVYEPASKRERATLHGSVGHVRAGEGGGKGNVRARNVLQHGISWIGEVDFGELLDGEKERSRAEEMRRRLVEMGGGKTEKEVGFSLEG
jgi:nicotinamide N-methyltransferase